MQIKNTNTLKQKFNFELNRSFDQFSLDIKKSDISLSVSAIYNLKEYIRFSCFDNYIHPNKKNLNKYCRLLLNFENCKHTVLVKSVHQICLSLLNETILNPYTTTTVDLCLALSESHSEDVVNQCNEVMTLCFGSKIRGISM
ncbi:MAG: hypothetical protein VW397_04340 [Candidatus Margulisiibacteriota bacterium]